MVGLRSEAGSIPAEKNDIAMCQDGEIASRVRKQAMHMRRQRRPACSLAKRAWSLRINARQVTATPCSGNFSREWRERGSATGVGLPPPRL